MNTEAEKTMLLAEKERIETQLNRLGYTTTEAGDWVVRPDEGDGDYADPIDNADRIEDFEQKIAILRVLEEEYDEVKKKLAELE